MQLLLLVSIAIFANLCLAQTQPGCCLENFGQTCDGNQLPKKYCPTGAFSCCPTQSGDFQCCGPLTQCDFVQKKCVLSSSFNYGPNPSPATIKLGFFSESLSFLLAQQQGYFQQENIIVQGQRVSSSQQQFAFLANGSYDVISTAIDNPLSYIRNKNPPFNLLGRYLDILAFYGTDRNLNQSIFLNPRGRYPTIASIVAAKANKDNATRPRIGVDSTETGFAYLVYDIFRTFGLERDVDYLVVAVGGGNSRLAAINRASTRTVPFADAGVLGGENALQAIALGLNPEVNVFQQIGAVEGGVLVANRTFLDPAGIPGIPNGVIARFTRAFYKGTKYALDPANREAIIAFLTATAASVNPPAFYQVNVDPNTGLNPTGYLDQTGTLKIINIRNNNNGFEDPTSALTRCRLSVPRGGIIPQLGQNRNALYESDTLKYVISTVPGATDRPPVVDYTCGGTVFGIVNDDEGNAAQGTQWSVIAMIVMAVALIVY